MVREAARTAARLQNRMYLESLLRLLTSARTRGIGIEALTSYGDRIAGTLADVLLDTTTPVAVRRQIPRLRNERTCAGVQAESAWSRVNSSSEKMRSTSPLHCAMAAPMALATS